MKVFQTKKSIVGGALDKCKQGIAIDKMSFAVSFLRDRIYTDKLKACLAETLTNAVDEHRKYNVQRPVDVILTEKELCIRDYAKGLSDNDVMRIFFQYFESTKNHSNEGIGGFGIGAKSPGAYSDIYYVVSFFNGEKTLFMSSVNGLESEVSKLYKENCDRNDTGICVRIPITNTEHIKQFEKIIQDLYCQIGFFQDKQEIAFYNLTTNSTTKTYLYDDWLQLTNKEKEMFKVNFANKDFRSLSITKPQTYIENECFLFRCDIFRSDFFSSCRFWAYDGDMCYKLDISFELLKSLRFNVWNCTYILFFNRGELPISPTRESIEITDDVKKWIESKLKCIKTKILNACTDDLITGLNSNLPFGLIYNNVLFNGPVSHFLSITPLDLPNTRINDIANVAKKTYNFNDTNLDSSLKINASRFYCPTIFDLKANTIFILSDKKLTIPYEAFYKAFKAFITEKYGDDYPELLNSNLKSCYYFCFVYDADKLQSFESFNKGYSLENNGEKINFLRKDIDYFDLKDILVHSTYKRPTSYNKKSGNIKTVQHDDLYDYTYGEKISESEYKNTLIFCNSDLKDSSYNEHSVAFRDFINLWSHICYHEDFEEMGIKHIAKVEKRKLQFYTAKGCMDINTFSFNFKERFDKFLKRKNYIIVPENIYRFISILDMWNDIPNIIGHKIYRKPYYRLNYLVERFDTNIDSYKEYINDIDLKFKKILLCDISNEELNCLYDAVISESVSCSLLANYDQFIHAKIVKIKSDIKTQKIIKAKKIFGEILKKINFKYN